MQLSDVYSISFPSHYALLGTALIVAHYSWQLIRARSLHFPPGPRPDPILGNLRHLLGERVEWTLADLRKKFGDIIYMSVFGRSIIVLSSIQTVQDLMDKRGAVYSDRPVTVATGEIMGWDKTLGLIPYGDGWRRQRRFVQGYFNQKILEKYRSLQEEEMHILLHGFLTVPEEFSHHIHRYAAAIIMRVTYGHTINSPDDEFVVLLHRATTTTAAYGSAGLTIVDLIPVLRHVPPWFPGAGFIRRLLEIKSYVRQSLDIPYELVKSKMEKGTSPPCLIASLLESSAQEDNQADIETDIKGAAGMIYSAGYDTSVCTIDSFILAMLLYPKVYKKAQEEIDRVIGSDRLPGYDDRPSLPYFESLMKEVYRWNPPVPLGLPHASSQDDEYKGYFIPKKSIIIGNIWWMMHDPKNYPDPESFRPERFFEEGGKDLVDPRDFVFGFGRRLCPGQGFADMSVWLVAVNIAASFDLAPAKDEMGNLPRRDFVKGIVSHPLPFRCVITPRSESRRRLIELQKL